MRILYVVHQFFPEGRMGTERFTLNMARAMRRAGHHVRVLAWSDSKRPFPRESEGFVLRDYSFEGIPVTAFRYKGSEPWDFYLSLGNRSKLFRLAERILASGRYDLIHFTHFLRVTPFAFAAMEKKIPYVATLTDFHTICHRGIMINMRDELCAGPRGGMTCAADCQLPQMTEDYLFQRVLSARHILSGARLVTAPSRQLAEKIRREHPAVEIKVVPHGISIERKAGLNGGDRLGASPVRFGFLGQVERHKGVHVLLKAFRKIADPACRLDIFGRTNDNDYAMDLLALAHGDPRITFHGAYDGPEELLRILENLDAVCVPSVWPENYPLVVLEALARKVPVIGARIGGIPEMIRDGSNGFLFEPNDPDSLHSAMSRIVGRPEALIALKRGISAVRTVKDEAAEFERLYRSALRPRASTKSRLARRASPSFRRA